MALASRRAGQRAEAAPSRARADPPPVKGEGAAMSKFARRGRPPPGYEVLEDTLEALEKEMRVVVDASHEGKRKLESLWPVHQINHQRTRYVFDMHYKYGRISKDVWDYCVRNRIIDSALASKWRKKGYERLCSTYVINPKNYKFGTVSICRVPKAKLHADVFYQDPTTGCLGCATGEARNIFGNKYGQRLADIQVARELLASAPRPAAREQERAFMGGPPADDEEDDDDDEYDDDDEDVPLPPGMPAPAAAAAAAAAGAEAGGSREGGSGPPPAAASDGVEESKGPEATRNAAKLAAENGVWASQAEEEQVSEVLRAEGHLDDDREGSGGAGQSLRESDLAAKALRRMNHMTVQQPHKRAKR